MTYDLERPVRCSFKVEVNLDEHRAMLDLVAARGAFELVVGEDCPQPHTRPTPWISTTCRTRAIKTALLYEG